MKEKLQEYALIAEIISSVAVVLSLLYVGFEIRQNSEQARIANRQSIATRVEQIFLAAANNSQIYGLNEDERIEDLDRVRRREMNFFNAAFYRNAEEAYLMYLEGQLSEEYWQTRGYFVVDKILYEPYTREWYQEAKAGFTPRFREWLEAELARSPGAGN